MTELDGVTRDALFDGAVTLLQPAQGYRVNVDSLLLAAFAAGAPGELRRVERVIDLGAGVGAVTLALAHLVGIASAQLLERDGALAALARDNVSAARLAAEVHELELGRLPDALHGSADLVVCNPPYFAPGSGRVDRRDPARFGPLAPFVTAAAAAFASARARAAFVYPAGSLPELLSAATSAGLVAKRIRLVHPLADEPARLALVELRRARPGGLRIEPPLVEWLAREHRSAEVTALLERPAADRR